jgi:caffeoyl-CoA O-methyltransferase
MVARFYTRPVLDDRVSRVLARLEDEDARERAEGLPMLQRSRAIRPTTGRFLFSLCAGQPGCEVLELGGSRGYSTIWLGAAVRILGGHVTSLEVDPAKHERSTLNIGDAGLDDWVEIIPGDAREALPSLPGPYDLVFLDAEKDLYEELFRLARPKLEPGGIVVADNILSHAETLAAYAAARQADPGLVSITVPLDSGLELTSVLTGSLKYD